MSTPTGYQERTFKSRELLSPKAQGDFLMVSPQYWRVKPVLLRPNLFHVGSGFVFILHPSSTPLNMRVPIGIMKFAFPLPALCHHQTHSLSSFEKGIRIQYQPWLVWLSGLTSSLGIERSLVQFPVRAHAWGAGMWEETDHPMSHTSRFLSHSSCPLSSL